MGSDVGDEWENLDFFGDDRSFEHALLDIDDGQVQTEDRGENPSAHLTAHSRQRSEELRRVSEWNFLARVFQTDPGSSANSSYRLFDNVRCHLSTTGRHAYAISSEAMGNIAVMISGYCFSAQETTAILAAMNLFLSGSLLYSLLLNIKLKKQLQTKSQVCAYLVA